MVTKQQMIDAISTLPDDATVEDAIDRLNVIYKIERGIAQADAGKTYSIDEVRERLRQWLR